jgi:phosphatidylglycerophosphate synthase
MKELGHKQSYDDMHGLTYIISKYLSIPVVDYLRTNYNLTPNHLTLISYLGGISAIYCLIHRYLILYSFFIIIAVVFDYYDGIMARRYNMETEFGNIFDHYTDVFTFVGVLLVLLHNYKMYRHPLLLIFYLLYLLLVSLQIICMEVIYDSKTNRKVDASTLGVMKKYCPNAEIVKHATLIDHGSTIILMIFAPLICICLEK